MGRESMNLSAVLMLTSSLLASGSALASSNLQPANSSIHSLSHPIHPTSWDCPESAVSWHLQYMALIPLYRPSLLCTRDLQPLELDSSQVPVVLQCEEVLAAQLRWRNRIRWRSHHW